MAKYNLSSNGSSAVNCDILNESDGMYIVRFENGAIQSVNKDRVHSLNDIDEGVLDMAKKAGEEISKFGRKVVSKAKDAAKAIKEFFINAFKMGGFVFFQDENGDALNASHPINAMIAAESDKSINVIPSSTTVEVCNEVGVEPRAIENFEYEGEYCGALQDDSLDESVKRNSVLKSLNERKEDFVTGRPIDPHSPSLGASKTKMYEDVTSTEMIDMIVEEYEGRLAGKWRALPYFIWGAPGTGKTEIISSILKILEKAHGERPGMIAINARTLSSERFSFPASVMKGLSDEEAAIMAKIQAKKSGASYEDVLKKFKDESSKTAVISDLPKDWMPVYNPKDPRGPEFVEMSRRLANGGKVDPETGELKDGPGGFIFIDEYARMSDDAVASLMQLPASRYFSTEAQTLGDRWVVIAAANRKGDLGARANTRDFVAQDAAMNTRWQIVNFVPKFDEWKAWASGDRGNGQRNVHPDIVNYIEKSIDEGRAFGEEFGDFYNMSDIHGGETTTGEPKACPRSWESASEIFYALLRKYGDVNSIPDDILRSRIQRSVGAPVAKRLVEFMKKFKFSNEDAKAVWAKGRTMPATEKDLRGYLNAGNFESFIMNFVFPKLEEEFPNAMNQNGISPENVLNVVNWIESIAPQKTGGNGRLDSGILRKIYKVFGTDIAGVELIDYENDGSRDLYADPRNRVADILMSNDSAA